MQEAAIDKKCYFMELMTQSHFEMFEIMKFSFYSIFSIHFAWQ